MNSRERVRAAVSLEQPDTVPIDLGGTRDSSIVIEGYQRLREHFGLKAPNVYCDRMMRVVRVDEDVLAKLDIDTRAMFAGHGEVAEESEGDDEYRDAWGIERTRPSGGYYYDQTSYPLSGEIAVADVARYPWPDPEAPAFVEGLKERLAWIRENTECAAILTLPAPFVHLSQYLRGFEDWYCDFALKSDVLPALFDAVLEITMRIAQRELEEVGAEVDVIICADDLGTQSGLQISRDDYVRLIKPRHAKYFEQVKRMSGAKLLFHSCGSLTEIIDDLVDIGVDVLNPVQVTATGMEPTELKKKYGKHLAFWGAMDTQHVLPHGTVEDVRKMVRERVEQLGEGGGYVLSSCHNLQPDVPTENILAMFDCAREYVPSFMK